VFLLAIFGACAIHFLSLVVDGSLGRFGGHFSRVYPINEIYFSLGLLGTQVQMLALILGLLAKLGTDWVVCGSVFLGLICIHSL
jgi:hypothetical protein